MEHSFLFYSLALSILSAKKRYTITYESIDYRRRA